MPIHRFLENHTLDQTRSGSWPRRPAYGGRALDNSSRYSQIIYDWFINSGV
jgi:hypothetical protein